MCSTVQQHKYRMLLEASTLTQLVPNASIAAKILRTSWVPHDLNWHKIDRPSGQFFKTLLIDGDTGNSILAVSDTSAVLTVKIGNSVMMIMGDGVWYHVRGRSGDYSVSSIENHLGSTGPVTWYMAVASPKQSEHILQRRRSKQQQRNAKQRESSYEVKARRIAERFQPFWPRLLAQALADTRGHADHLISRGAWHGEVISDRISVAQELYTLQRRLKKGQDILPEMTRVFYNAMVMTAHQLYPHGDISAGHAGGTSYYDDSDDSDDEGHWINSTPIMSQGKLAVLDNYNGMKTLTAELASHPEKILPIILGYAKQELLHK